MVRLPCNRAIPMERPNTVAGLVAKRTELLKLRKSLELELRQIVSDVDHLDAAIRCFDPANTPAARKRYGAKHRAKKGHLKRFVLDRLKEAEGPITSRDITEAWIAARGLRTDDATFVLLRKWVGACLTAAKAAGLVNCSVPVGGYNGWLITPHPFPEPAQACRSPRALRAGDAA